MNVHSIFPVRRRDHRDPEVRVGVRVEFKFDRSAKAAIRQIREKDYTDVCKGDRRPVALVGINFRKAKRNIDEPLFEPFPDSQFQVQSGGVPECENW